MKNKRIVIKVGTSTITYKNGKANLRTLDELGKVISDLQNQGNEITLVSSGAIGIGIGKAGAPKGPMGTKEKQAYAAVGQCELMFIYDKIFTQYNHIIAQILLTKDCVDIIEKRRNILNTFNTLFKMNVIPIVNENDTVATDELKGHNFGDNDMLSAIVAKLINADKLIILTDIDGLHDQDPRLCATAKKIPYVEKITDKIMQMAGGTGSKRGTGGMTTKLLAAQYATSAGVECCVISGEDPNRIYEVLENKDVGTTFATQ